MNFKIIEKLYSGIFRIAENESAVTIPKFKTVLAKWRPCTLGFTKKHGRHFGFDILNF